MDNCYYCGSNIPESARLCKHCKSYRARWRNWLPHVSAIIALLGFAGTIWIYAVSSAIKFYEEYIVEDQLSTPYFKSSGAQTFVNLGSRALYLGHVRLDSEQGGVNQVVRINERIEPGEFFSRDQTKVDLETKGVTPTKSIVLEALNDEDLKRFYETSKTDRARCVRFSFYRTMDPAYREYRRVFELKDKKMFEFPGTGKLVYLTATGEEKTSDLDMSVVFSGVDTEECRQWYQEILGSSARETANSDSPNHL